MSYCECSVDGVVGEDPGVSAGLSQGFWTGGFDENHVGLQFPRPQQQDALKTSRKIWVISRDLNPTIRHVTFDLVPAGAQSMKRSHQTGSQSYNLPDPPSSVLVSITHMWLYVDDAHPSSSQDVVDGVGAGPVQVALELPVLHEPEQEVSEQ